MDITQITGSFKKHSITVIAVLALVVAFCCVFAFAGDDVSDVGSVSISSEISSVADSTSFGVALYVDGEFVAVCESSAVAEEALAQLLASRSAALGISSSAEVSFNNEISYVQGEYKTEEFSQTDDLLFALKEVELSVRSVSTASEVVVLEYETKTIFTDSLRDGVEKVVSKGYNGEGNQTTQIVSIDGVEVERSVISLEVTAEPTTKIVRVGTCSNGINVASLGTFIKPYDGVVTSYLGPRWGRTHNGIDIAGDNCNRKPVVAACDGVVVRADRYGGYGNCVIIDHGDGIQTLYAHLSAFSVSVGEEIKAGEQVGNIGSTGNSTGPHLHFEVRIDGEIVNPLIFVDYE